MDLIMCPSTTLQQISRHEFSCSQQTFRVEYSTHGRMYIPCQTSFLNSNYNLDIYMIHSWDVLMFCFVSQFISYELTSPDSNVDTHVHLIRDEHLRPGGNNHSHAILLKIYSLTSYAHIHIDTYLAFLQFRSLIKITLLHLNNINLLCSIQYWMVCEKSLYIICLKIQIFVLVTEGLSHLCVYQRSWMVIFQDI